MNKEDLETLKAIISRACNEDDVETLREISIYLNYKISARKSGQFIENYLNSEEFKFDFDNLIDVLVMNLNDFKIEYKFDKKYNIIINVIKKLKGSYVFSLLDTDMHDLAEITGIDEELIADFESYLNTLGLSMKFKMSKSEKFRLKRIINSRAKKI